MTSSLRHRANFRRYVPFSYRERELKTAFRFPVDGAFAFSLKSFDKSRSRIKVRKATRKKYHLPQAGSELGSLDW